MHSAADLNQSPHAQFAPLSFTQKQKQLFLRISLKNRSRNKKWKIKILLIIRNPCIYPMHRSAGWSTKEFSFNNSNGALCHSDECVMLSTFSIIYCLFSGTLASLVYDTNDGEWWWWSMTIYCICNARICWPQWPIYTYKTNDKSNEVENNLLMHSNGWSTHPFCGPHIQSSSPIIYIYLFIVY